MALEVDYLPVATSGTANVDPQSSFAGSPYQLNGFVNGIASPQQANKLWRQSSMVAAAIANFISTILNIPILDDGNLPVLVSNFFNAIHSVVTTATAGLQPLLGFNPVQGGNGAGQEGNIIHIGWSGPTGGNRLLVSVDAAAQGPLVFDSQLNPQIAQLHAEDTNLQTEINAANAEINTINAAFANAHGGAQGYYELPNGIIEMWGTITQDINGGQLAVSFAPTGIPGGSFPHNCFNVSITTFSPTDRITFVVQGSVTTAGFTAGNNGSSGFAMWRAVGN